MTAVRAARQSLAMLEWAGRSAIVRLENGDAEAAVGDLLNGINGVIETLSPYANPREETVHADPDVLFGPPFGVWREIAPGLELMVYAHEAPGTFHVRKVDSMPPMPPHTLIVLSNGSTLRTTQNSPGDIAGLINANVAKIYQVEDLDGVIHHLTVSAILDFYAVTP